VRIKHLEEELGKGRREVVLLRILEVLVSNLAPETGYPD